VPGHYFASGGRDEVVVEVCVGFGSGDGSGDGGGGDGGGHLLVIGFNDG
jgi:hypothetical protein